MRFRASHGKTPMLQMATESANGRSHSSPRWYSSYPHQASETGRNAPSDGLTSSAKPHSAPNPIQFLFLRLAPSGSAAAHQKSSASSSALRLVSHSHVTLHLQNHGKSAQIHAAHSPAVLPVVCSAMPRIGIVVNAENRLCPANMKMMEATL